MGFAIHVASWLPGSRLEVLALTALVRVGVRRYPLLFAYLVVTFLVAAIQAPVSLRFSEAIGEGDWYQLVNLVGDSTRIC